MSCINKNLDLVLSFIKQCNKPFSLDLSEDHLYNISKRQTVSDEIHLVLSHAESDEEKQRLKFISESISKSDRFDRLIPKIKK